MKVETGMMSGQTVSNGELYNVDYHMPQVQVPEEHFRGQALTDLTAFTWFTQAWISGLQYLTVVSPAPGCMAGSDCVVVLQGLTVLLCCRV